MCLCAGYRHVYLEGMEEASIFVHVAVNDITGKVGTTTDSAAETKPSSAVRDITQSQNIHSSRAR